MRYDSRIAGAFVVLLICLYAVHDFPRTEKISDGNRAFNVDQLLLDAEAAHNRGHYQEAIDIYASIIAREPGDLRPYLRTGHTYRYWGHYEESEKWFRRAVELAPDDAWAWTDLGKLYRNMGKYDEAEKAFLRSIQLDPYREEAYGYGLGYLYLETRRFEEAETMFKKALEINPTSDLALSGLADLYRETGRYEESEAQFRKVFEHHPHSEAYLGLAWLYIKQERYDEAIPPLESFLTNIREKGDVYFALGTAHLGAGHITDAVEAFEQAVRLNPETDRFRVALTQARSRLK